MHIARAVVLTYCLNGAVAVRPRGHAWHVYDYALINGFAHLYLLLPYNFLDEPGVGRRLEKTEYSERSNYV